MKLAVYTIAKNEEANIQDWVKASYQADHFVFDTGSTDDTKFQCFNNDVRVVPGAVIPWRFDVARNVALSLIPPDYDLCLRLDMDERPQPGWYEAVEKVWAPGVTRVSYKYIWDFNPDGTPKVWFRHNNCHSRAGYFWKGPTHEALYPMGITEKFVDSDMVIHQHREKTSHDHVNRDLELLEVAVQEDKGPRPLFYLAREYFYCLGKPQYADQRPALLVKFFETSSAYLRHPDNMFAEERAEMLRIRAMVYRMYRPDFMEAEHCLYQAIADTPRQRANWVDLAWLYTQFGEVKRAAWAARQALEITDPGPYPTHSYVWDNQAMVRLVALGDITHERSVHPCPQGTRGDRQEAPGPVGPDRVPGTGVVTERGGPPLPIGGPGPDGGSPPERVHPTGHSDDGLPAGSGTPRIESGG